LHIISVCLAVRQVVHSYTSTVKTWSGGKAPYIL